MHELLDGACMDKSTKQGFLVIINRGKIVILFFLLPFYFFPEGRILGGILLIGGLYSVLWGKSKESEFASCSDMNTIDGAQDVQEHNKPDADMEAKSAAAGGQV